MRVSEKELIAVEKAMKNEKNTRIYKRYRSLYLYLSGESCRKIAKTIGISKTIVSRINQVYYE